MSTPKLYQVNLNWHGEEKAYIRWARSPEQVLHYATRELGRELKKSATNIRMYFEEKAGRYTVKDITPNSVSEANKADIANLRKKLEVHDGVENEDSNRSGDSDSPAPLVGTASEASKGADAEGEGAVQLPLE